MKKVIHNYEIVDEWDTEDSRVTIMECQHCGEMKAVIKKGDLYEFKMFSDLHEELICKQCFSEQKEILKNETS